jgi:hypothetical protein
VVGSAAAAFTLAFRCTSCLASPVTAHRLFSPQNLRRVSNSPYPAFSRFFTVCLHSFLSS